MTARAIILAACLFTSAAFAGPHHWPLDGAENHYRAYDAAAQAIAEGRSYNPRTAEDAWSAFIGIVDWERFIPIFMQRVAAISGGTATLERLPKGAPGTGHFTGPAEYFTLTRRAATGVETRIAYLYGMGITVVEPAAVEDLRIWPVPDVMAFRYDTHYAGASSALRELRSYSAKTVSENGGKGGAVANAFTAAMRHRERFVPTFIQWAQAISAEPPFEEPDVEIEVITAQEAGLGNLGDGVYLRATRPKSHPVQTRIAYLGNAGVTVIDPANLPEELRPAAPETKLTDAAPTAAPRSTAINIAGIDRAALVMALFEHSRPAQDHFMDGALPELEAALHVGKPMGILFGRGMYVNVPAAQDGDTVDVTAYDAHNGVGAAAAVIDSLPRRATALRAGRYASENRAIIVTVGPPEGKGPVEARQLITVEDTAAKQSLQFTFNLPLGTAVTVEGDAFVVVSSVDRDDPEVRRFLLKQGGATSTHDAEVELSVHTEFGHLRSIRTLARRARWIRGGMHSGPLGRVTLSRVDCALLMTRI